jgi:hypothetical protein
MSVTATIIPFRKRPAATSAVVPISAESLMANFVHRMGYYGPEDYEPGGPAANAGLRPLPGRGDLVSGVLLRANVRRAKRQREEGN